MLTKKEILARLKDDDVDMGDNPGRVFDFYLDKGLILRSKERRKRLCLYPDETVEIIRKIKHLRSFKYSLSEIKVIFDKTRKEEADKQKEYLNDWTHQQKVLNRIKSVIKIDEDQGYDLYVLEKVNIKEDKKTFFAVVVSSENDEITWINIDITATGEEELLGNKIMSLGEYNVFIQTLANKQMEKGKVIKQKDIFETIFNMYFT